MFTCIREKNHIVSKTGHDKDHITKNTSTIIKKDKKLSIPMCPEQVACPWEYTQPWLPLQVSTPHKLEISVCSSTIILIACQF